MATDSPITPRPSAAVVLLRDEEDGCVSVFMVRRHAASPFMPDVFVFPGGAVTPDDLALEQTTGLCEPVDEGITALGHGYRAAAVRECFEEAGVLLARRAGTPLVIQGDDVQRFRDYRHGLNSRSLTLADVVRRDELTLATDELLHWAHWITPEESPIRFETHFFLAAMPHGQEAVPDHRETTAGVWVSPEEAIARSARGEMPLSDPTLHQVRELTGLPSVAAAWQRFRGRRPRTILPRRAYRDGREVMVVPDEE